MQPLRRGRSAYARGTPVRWTTLEIMLIILSLVMMVVPLSLGVLSLIVVPSAPAQELAQGPTRTATTPTGDTPTATATASSTPTTIATASTATITATATASSTPTTIATASTATITATATASSTPTTIATASTATITATATVTATTGIQLFKLASLTEVVPGQPFRYTIWVATTSSTAQTVIFEDALDTNLELLDVSATPGSCSAAQIVRCNLETRSDEPAVVRIQVRVRTGVAPNTVITNSATANGVSSATISVRVSEWVIPSATTPSPITTLPPTLVPTTATPGVTLPPATPTSPSVPPTEPPIEEEEPPPTATFTSTPTPTPTPTSTPQPSPTLLPPTPTTTIAPPARRPTTPIVRATILPVAETLTPTATLAPTVVVVATTSATTEAGTLFFRAASDWGSAYPEQQVGFTFVVENSRPAEPTGANDLLDLQLTGRLPNNLELLGASANRGSDPQIGGQDVVHYLARLQPGESLELSIMTKIRPQVAAGTLLIAQGQLSYAGLAQELFSNIVAVQVVSARPPAEALLMQIAAAYPEPPTPTTSPLPPTATAPPPTLTSTLVATVAPTPSTVPLAAPPPAQPTPLPHTQGMLPLVGILLLGTTLFTRTLRLHRARGRL